MLGWLYYHLEGMRLEALSFSQGTLPNITMQQVNDHKNALPEKYDGIPTRCRTLQYQCENFSLQQSAFPSERVKVAHVISFLVGRAAQWATAECARSSGICSSYKPFSEEDL